MASLVVSFHPGSQRDNAMRSRKIAFAFCGVAFAFGVCSGCGDEPGGQAELAKLPPPSSEATVRAKSQPPKSKPKFGSPPKSQMVPPTDRSP
jgi:hypothetical protein